MVKQRITFQLDSLEAIDTDNLILNEEEVIVPGTLFNRREDRLTLYEEEIPPQYKELFERFYEFEIKWSSFKSKPDLLFQNFQTKGFSVNLIPADANYEPIFDKFGEFLNKTFHIGFNHKNLISQPVSATFHSFVDLKTSIIQKFMRDLTKYVDLTLFIDDIKITWKDKKLILKWTSPPVDSVIKQTDITKEIAFFQIKDLTNDLEVSGMRTILSPTGHTPPIKTMLFVKPRHHKIINSITNQTQDLNFEFESNTNLHPTLKISNFNNLISPNPEQCELFMYSTIENSLIFDKYQFDKEVLYLINSWGSNDLEAPIWKIDNFGSNQLFQILKINKDFEIKFHSRYLNPTDDSNDNKFKFITPQFFWACDASNYIEDYEQISQNPFDNLGLGYESLFEDSTIFYHYENIPTVLDYEIPSGKKSDFNSIQLITLVSIILGSLFIIKKLITPLIISSRDSSKDSKDSKKKK